MVCKEDVELWFRELSGHKRIDVMCSLLEKCLPFELRFFGTCLEYLGKQNFNQMKDYEVKANNPTELSDLLVQCIISDTRTRQKLALYICLVHSLNTTCSNTLFKTLSTLDISQIMPITKKTDDTLLEELLLIYTIAVNHPVFTFDQKTTLGNILLQLRSEEERIQTENVTDEFVTPGDCHTEFSTRPPPVISTGYTVNITPPGNFLPIPTNSPFPIHVPPPTPANVIWRPVDFSIPIDNLSLVQDVPNVPPPPLSHTNVPLPSSSTIHMSRQSSPSQSTSPSRNASPIRKNHYHTNIIDKGLHSSSSKLNNVERYDEHGHKFDDEFCGLLEKKVADLSLDEFGQQTKGNIIVNMNGVTEPELVEYSPIIQHNAITHVPNGVFYNCPRNITRTLDPNLVNNQPQSMLPLKPSCLGQIATFRSGYPVTASFNSDQESSHHYSSSSSCSDASSASHSPPSTPANSNQNWDKDLQSEDTLQKVERGNSRVLQVSRGRCRLGLPHGVQTLPRARGPHSSLLLENSKKNVHNVSSSRRDGPSSAPPTPHEEKKCYTLTTPDVTSSSPSVLSLKSPSSTAATVVSGSKQQQQQQQPPLEMVTTGVPYTQSYLPPHFSPLFTAYPAPHPPATFVRPPTNFTFPNGDVMFPFSQTQPPPPPPPPPLPIVQSTGVVSFPANLPPPKLSCYNCSSQTHHANDCKEPTMEEYSSKGQYRIDYKPFNKQGECLTDK